MLRNPTAADRDDLMAATVPAAAGDQAHARGRVGPTRPAATTARRSSRDPLVLMAGALALLPMIAAAVSALRNPWAPTNDWALLELEVRRVGTGDTPLLGAWSRYGWQHPGPLPFYLMALPYRLAPAEHGLLFAAATVNLAAAAGYVAVAARHPRARALVVLVGVAALLYGLGVDQLSDPWNPILPIVPFALYVLLAVEVAMDRRPWSLPALVGVGSFVVQAHVAFAQPVTLLAVAALALRRRQGGRRDRRADAAASAGGTVDGAPPTTDERPRPRWRSTAPTVIVALVAWLPPLIDQVAGSGNLGMLARWAAGDRAGEGMGTLTQGRLPLGRVVDAAAWLLDPLGLWVGRYTPAEAYGVQLLGTGPPLVLLWVPAALGLVVVVVRRVALADDDRRAVVAAGVLAATVVGATVTNLLSVRGAPVLWPFRWVPVVVMVLLVAVGWAAAGTAAARRSPRHDGATDRRRHRLGAPVAAPATVTLVATLVAVTVWGGTTGRQPAQDASLALLRLVPAIEEHAGDEPLVSANTTNMLNDKDLGLPVILDRAGIPWVEHDDPRAHGHPGFSVKPASALDGLLAHAVAAGDAEVMARSGPPRPGEAPDSELVLVRIGPT